MQAGHFSSAVKYINFIRMSFSPADGISFWLKIIAAVAVIVVIASFFMVNREVPRPVDLPAVEYSSGEVAVGEFEIPEDGELSFRILLNRRSLLKGDFASVGKLKRIECLVLDVENYQARKSGGEWKALSRTGYVPGGRLNRELSPGEYRVVVDAQDGEGPVAVRLDLVLE
jgi:hypothetical protein